MEGVTQATWQANITSYISQVKAAGVDKVIFLTILPRDSFGAVNPAFETARQTWNTWVRANAVSTGIDAIADVGADATIGQAGQEDNLTYYVDGTHTTAAGDAIVQGLVIAAINSVVTLK